MSENENVDKINDLVKDIVKDKTHRFDKSFDRTLDKDEDKDYIYAKGTPTLVSKPASQMVKHGRRPILETALSIITPRRSDMSQEEALINVEILNLKQILK